MRVDPGVGFNRVPAAASVNKPKLPDLVCFHLLQIFCCPVPCMHLSSLNGYAFSRFVAGPSLSAIGVRANTRCNSRAACALPRLDRLSRLSSPVHRRQLLTTTSLSFLSSWLPFSTMSANAAFELPGEKWWSKDTVAIVTGGKFAAPLCREVCSL